MQGWPGIFLGIVVGRGGPAQHTHGLPHPCPAWVPSVPCVHPATGSQVAHARVQWPPGRAHLGHRKVLGRAVSVTCECVLLGGVLMAKPVGGGLGPGLTT